MIDHEPELDLIERAQTGDRHAFSELVRRYRAAVIRVVYRMCGDSHVAEDAAQEAFIRAWMHLPRYQPRSAFRSWLYRIATNAALDVLRRQKPTTDIDELPLCDTTLGPERVMVVEERASLVREAVMALSPASRAALILREYEGMSYQEIADTLEIPIGTVMSRLNYARKQLRILLEDVNG
ncbi:MAG: sigma-70 family RNA polymerase sigma factor [Chloroflexi bacterium]|nr:sigma-70 family RNA polymerase sigma factor [Chloroflexota bacterium]